MKRFTVLLFLLFAACSVHEAPASKATLKIRLLDVGQGLAVLLESDGKFAMFDTGPDSADVSGALQALSARDLEWVAVSHLHRDHAGGFLEFGPLKTGFSYKRFLWSGDTAHGTAEHSFVRDSVERILASRGIAMERLARGDSIAFAGHSFKVLWPPADEMFGENAASLVLSMKIGNESLLLVGDLEAAQEERLLQMSGTLSATVLQVGHHGSNTSSSLKFLETASPTYTLIGVGNGNSYGHPTSETLQKLYYVTGDSTRVLRTDRHGTICLEWVFNVGIWPCS